MNNILTTIGRAEKVHFPRLGLIAVPARIDTGAKTSAIWASNIEEKNGELSFRLFGPKSKLYTGNVITTTQFEVRAVASSMGAIEERYVVKFVIELHERKIKASFTLANRAAQVYPVLVGRNVLRGKFLVDVKRGQPLIREEQDKEKGKRAYLSRAKQQRS